MLDLFLRHKYKFADVAETTAIFGQMIEVYTRTWRKSLLTATLLESSSRSRINQLKKNCQNYNARNISIPLASCGMIAYLYLSFARVNVSNLYLLSVLMSANAAIHGRKIWGTRLWLPVDLEISYNVIWYMFIHTFKMLQ